MSQLIVCSFFVKSKIGRPMSVHTRLEAEDTKTEQESVTHGELEEDTDFLVGIYLFVERKLIFQRAPAGESIRTFPTRLTYSIRYNSKPMTYTFACNLSELSKSNLI